MYISWYNKSNFVIVIFLVISTTGGRITNEQVIQSYLEQIQAMLHRSI